jgi:uncharacterized integral membrane protein
MRPKIIIIIFLLFLLVVFAVQNAAGVGVRLLFWDVTIPLSVLVAFMFVVGIVTGVILVTWKKSEKVLKTTAEEETKSPKKHD